MDSKWKKELCRRADAARRGRGPGTTTYLLAVAGKPMSIRKARGRLFGVMREVLNSKPSLISIEEDELAILISLRDLVEVLEMQSQTLKEGLKEAGFKPGPTRFDVPP